jgi:hypothetical protein
MIAHIDNLNPYLHLSWMRFDSALMETLAQERTL